MRQNPVQRGLVLKTQQWDGRSVRLTSMDERGAVLVNEAQKAELHMREIA